MASGVVKDAASNAFAGLSGNTYQFGVADSTAPTVSTYYPLNNAVDQPNSVNIVLTFSEDVQLGYGAIVLTPSGGNGPNNVISIDASSSQVTFQGTKMTINPANHLIDTGGK